MSQYANWCQHGVREPDVCEECKKIFEKRDGENQKIATSVWDRIRQLAQRLKGATQ